MLDARLRGHDDIFIYLILFPLLSFPRKRESRKMANFDFLRKHQTWILNKHNS